MEYKTKVKFPRVYGKKTGNKARYKRASKRVTARIRKKVKEDLAKERKDCKNCEYNETSK